MNTITTNQKAYINTLIENSSTKALEVGSFLIDKGIETLSTKQASYLINILNKYNTALPDQKNKKETHPRIETGYKEKPSHNYSQGAWEGVNYSLGLDCKEIAKLMRKELKRLYPLYKFSITSSYNQLNVYMTQAPQDPFENSSNIDFNLISINHTYGTKEEELKEQLENYRNKVFSSYSVNHYHIKDSWMLSPESKEIFTKIKDLLNSFNYDDSDSMTDYFSTKFYNSMGISLK